MSLTVVEHPKLDAGAEVPLDEDQRWTLDRAADLLEGYAEWIKAESPESLEQHPYLPEVELVASELRAFAPVQLTPEEMASRANGPRVRRIAVRLLKQLDENRPRRALDLDEVRHLLELLTAAGDADRLVAELIRSAWEWGVSCEIDSVRWGEAGDSHNQMWRDKTADIAARLHAALVTRDTPQG